MRAEETSVSYTHDAFISYSRNDDTFATALEATLEKYKPPKHLNAPQRYLDIFRDKHDFTAGDYHERLEKNLKASAKLIVICSPDARKSRWVDDEIRRFASISGADNIIPVLYNGIPNNEAKQDQEDEKAFPPALCELMEIPLAINFLGFDPAKDKVNKGVFLDAWHMLLANVYDLSRSVVEQREKKRRQRKRRLSYAALSGSTAVLAVLLIFALISRYDAVAARRDAEVQRNQAVASAAEATKQKDAAETARVEEQQQRQRAEEQTQVANEQRDIAQRQTKIAEERRREAERQQQIAFAGSTSARGEVVRNQGAIPNKIREYSSASPVNSWPDLVQRGLLLSVEGAKRIHKALGTYSLESTQALLNGVAHFPRTKMRFDLPDNAKRLMFSPDGNYLLAQHEQDNVRIWSLSAQALISEFEANIREIAFTDNGKYVAVWTEDHRLLVRDVLNDKELWSQPSQLDGRLFTFSRDGKFLVTSVDATAFVWEAATGKEISRVAHPARVTGATFNLDGSQLITGCEDHPARISNTLTGQELSQFKGSEDAGPFAFSSDGRLLAIAQRKTADIWDARSGKKLQHITGIPSEPGELQSIEHIVLSADGSSLAIFGSKGTTQLWDVATANLKWVAGESYEASLTEDKRHILIRQTSGVEVWDITTGEEVARLLHKPDIEEFAFNAHNNLFAMADGKSIVVVKSASDQEIERVTFRGYLMAPKESGPYTAMIDQNVVIVWEGQQASEIARFIHEEPIDAATFSNDGKYGATASADGYVRLWDVSTNREIARMSGVPSVIVMVFNDAEDEIINVKDFFFSPRGKYLVVVGRDKVTRVWSVPEGREIAAIKTKYPVDKLRFSEDDVYFAAIADGKTLLFQTTTGRQIDLPGADAFTFSDDGNLLATATPNVTEIYDVKTGKEVAKITSTVTGPAANNTITTLTFSPNGKLLAWGSQNQTAQLWSIADHKRLALINHAYVVSYTHFSRNGRFLFTGVLKAGGRSTLSVWDTRSRTEVSRIVHDDAIVDVVFSPDERYFATASDDYTARVFDLSTLKEIGRLSHDHAVGWLRFSSDNKYIVTTSRDNTARVWETSNARELIRLNHNAEVDRADFSPNNQFIVTASMDGTQRQWLWQPKDLIKRACDSLTRNLTRAEWSDYFGREPYRRTCRNLPEPENIY